MLRDLPKQVVDENVLVGMGHADDGGVYRLTDELALIQSLDFFTPVVDDPYTFGQIAAANALSDIYAMGGVPKTVLNIVAYPIKQLGPEILADILRGSSDIVAKSGAQIIGGHSIDDQEPKFGLSVTGTVHPEKFYKNIGAKAGDVLVLTKPIGVGILTTAIKRELLSQDETKAVVEVMTTLNKQAAESLTLFTPHAVTDITGFGLLGHAYEMTQKGDVSLVIHYADLPILDGTKRLAEQGSIPGGTKDNRAWLNDKISFADNLSEIDQFILCDVVTSGGLLISMSEADANLYIQQLSKASGQKAHIIGRVQERSEKAIYVS